MEICEQNKCNGCYACVNICPKSSIRMQENVNGFLYPVIDSSNCINCGLCIETCPVLNSVKKHETKQVYACINKSHEDYVTTTSGGIATLFSKKIVSEGGVVYGVATTSELDVEHIRVTDEDGVDKLKGSKYVQSTIGKNYVNIKKDIKDGRKVFFVGTPCQVAGLKNFLGREYENLYTCDIVCHGVPSIKYLKEHLAYICKCDGANKLSFRDKDGFYLELKNGEEILYRKRNFYDVFYMGFLKGLFFRESCYSCPYACENRVGDVTLGDFWGFNHEKEEFPVNTQLGLSLVMLNSLKGKDLFDKCKSDMVYQIRNIEEAVNGNKQLRKPSVKHRNYEIFHKNYFKYGFEKAAKRALVKERIVYAILGLLGK